MATTGVFQNVIWCWGWSPVPPMYQTCALHMCSSHVLFTSSAPQPSVREIIWAFMHLWHAQRVFEGSHLCEFLLLQISPLQITATLASPNCNLLTLVIFLYRFIHRLAFREMMIYIWTFAREKKVPFFKSWSQFLHPFVHSLVPLLVSFIVGCWWLTCIWTLNPITSDCYHWN